MSHWYETSHWNTQCAYSVFIFSLCCELQTVLTSMQRHRSFCDATFFSSNSIVIRYFLCIHKPSLICLAICVRMVFHCYCVLVFGWTFFSFLSLGFSVGSMQFPTCTDYNITYVRPSCARLFLACFFSQFFRCECAFANRHSSIVVVVVVGASHCACLHIVVLHTMNISQPASQPTRERVSFFSVCVWKQKNKTSRLHYVLDGAIEKLYFFALSF